MLKIEIANHQSGTWDTVAEVPEFETLPVVRSFLGFKWNGKKKITFSKAEQRSRAKEMAENIKKEKSTSVRISEWYVFGEYNTSIVRLANVLWQDGKWLVWENNSNG